MRRNRRIFVVSSISALMLTLTGCATTPGSSYPHMDVAEKTAADVAQHLDYLSDTQVVDCLDINTLMGALLMNNKEDLGVPRDIMLEIQGLNLLGWIAARDRRVTDEVTKEQVMQAGTFKTKFDALDEDASRTLLNEERVKCDAYLDKARDDNLAKIRAAKAEQAAG